MENEEQSRLIKFSYWLAQTSFAQFAFSSQLRVRISVFTFILFTHFFYWATAWYSPWPYIVFMLFGFWFSQGVYKPWALIIKQSYQPAYDSAMLKISVPFIILNYIALFSCLYMFGSVVDASGNEIQGTWKHFYFSTVTLTTLGYGNIVPNDIFSEVIATIQSIIGFMGFAVFAGIVASIALKRVELQDKN
ncbi:ion channel [Moritella sp. F3]|uniref:ion channel n=1 Tax=Moritella sp. F3 TaxID=2718882 RepID=UPI0018E1A3F2|nr:ion channel [Moritella sp. F3]GIC75343.1 hypothetical protein FMO001_00700 [Moritella sp. F1]GIC80488.1 hypothetical protein FMO003_07690 [Moritella sp. F3]